MGWRPDVTSDQNWIWRGVNDNDDFGWWEERAKVGANAFVWRNDRSSSIGCTDGMMFMILEYSKTIWYISVKYDNEEMNRLADTIASIRSRWRIEIQWLSKWKVQLCCKNKQCKLTIEWGDIWDSSRCSLDRDAIIRLSAIRMQGLTAISRLFVLRRRGCCVLLLVVLPYVLLFKTIYLWKSREKIARRLPKGIINQCAICHGLIHQVCLPLNRLRGNSTPLCVHQCFQSHLEENWSCRCRKSFAWMKLWCGLQCWFGKLDRWFLTRASAVTFEDPSPASCRCIPW